MIVIEQCFRSLKTIQIRIMPLRHRLEKRIVAHVKICVLSLLLQRVAELACERPWWRLRETLDALQVTEFETSTHRFWRRNRLPDGVGKILKTLKISKPKPVLAIERRP